MLSIPRDHHLHQRCYVVASGPSIKGMDLSHLKGKTVICVNESYKALPWDPSYICIGDRELWPLVKDQYAQMSSKLVTATGLDGTCGSDYAGDNMVARVPLHKDKTVLESGIPLDFEKGVYKAWNVIPEVVLPFCLHCGFAEVVLLGCDCTDAGYFYEDSARGVLHQRVLPKAMQAYEALAQDLWFEDMRVLNATPGGNLKCFPRVQYEDICGMGISPEQLVVIGYYTPDRNYPDLAARMKASVEQFGLTVDLVEKPSMANPLNPQRMTWVLNCSHCATVVREAMDRHPGKYLLYLDADAEMLARPNLFFDQPIDHDVMVVWLSNEFVERELVSNTIFFAPTRAARKLVQAWEAEQNVRNEFARAGFYESPFHEAWDQQVLQDVLEVPALRSKPAPRVGVLPWEYAKMDPTRRGDELMKGTGTTVIAQRQASRDNKAAL